MQLRQWTKPQFPDDDAADATGRTEAGGKGGQDGGDSSGDDGGDPDPHAAPQASRHLGALETDGPPPPLHSTVSHPFAFPLLSPSSSTSLPQRRRIAGVFDLDEFDMVVLLRVDPSALGCACDGWTGAGRPSALTPREMVSLAFGCPWRTCVRVFQCVVCQPLPRPFFLSHR